MFTDHELKLGTLFIPQIKRLFVSAIQVFRWERTLSVSAMQQNFIGLRFQHTPRNEHISCLNNRILGNIQRTNGVFRIHLGVWRWHKIVKKRIIQLKFLGDLGSNPVFTSYVIWGMLFISYEHEFHHLWKRTWKSLWRVIKIILGVFAFFSIYVQEAHTTTIKWVVESVFALKSIFY